MPETVMPETVMIDPVHLQYHTPARDGELPPAYDYDGLVGEFDSHHIDYEMFDHTPVFTVEEAHKVDKTIAGISVKNLFLRDKKRRPFLVTVLSERRVDLKGLRHPLGASGNLSFGNEAMLWELLGVRPGSVNPFCILNDTDSKVTPVVDTGLFASPQFNAHPLRNDKSVALSGDDLKRLYDIWGRTPLFINFDEFET